MEATTNVDHPSYSKYRRCILCGCLNDDHYDPTQSDDAYDIAALFGGSTPLNCCFDCASCDWSEYQEMRSQ